LSSILFEKKYCNFIFQIINIKYTAMPKPSPGTHPSYFQRYIDLVPEEDLQTAFKNQLPAISSLLQSITEEKANTAYAPGKWTIKELLLHMTDTERIFAYRSLCFARKEKASLPGFDENEYAANSNAGARSWQSLVDEFLLVRKSTEALFSSFTEDALNNSGIANNNPATAASMGFTAIGHVYHHKKILEERYL
jgi:uncharacterized damage-inducible protein DinB